MMNIENEKKKLAGLERELKTEKNLFRRRELKKTIKIIKKDMNGPKHEIDD